MLEVLFRWDAILGAVGILLTIGIGVLALGDFRIAKVCFALAAVDLFGGVIMWGISTPLDAKLRSLIVAISFATIGLVFVESLRYVERKQDAKHPEGNGKVSKIPRSETKSPPYPEFLFNSEQQQDGSIGMVLINPCDEPIDDVAATILKSPSSGEFDNIRDVNQLRQAMAARTQQLKPGLLRPQLAMPVGSLSPAIMPVVGVRTQYQINIYARHEAFTQYSSLTLHPNGFVQQRSQMSSNKTQEKLWELPNRAIAQRDKQQHKQAILENASAGKAFLLEQQERLRSYRGKSRERHRVEAQIVKEFIQSYGYRTNWALNRLAEEEINVEQEMRWMFERHSVAALLELTERVEELGNKLP